MTTEELFQAILELPDQDEVPGHHKCWGKIYRAEIECNHENRDDVLEWTVRLVKVKKLSCPGCDHCGWQHDGAYSDYFVCYDGIPGMADVIPGRLYRIDMIDVRPSSWESSICDDYDLEVVEVKKEDIPDYTEYRKEIAKELWEHRKQRRNQNVTEI